MILTTTNKTVPFKAPWRQDDPEAPVFHFRAGSVIERGLMEAEIAGVYRAGLVHGYELRAAVQSGIETLLAEDPDQGRVLELFEEELQHEIAKGEANSKGLAEPEDPLSAADRRLLTDVRSVLAQHWPDYRDLSAQIERRRAVAPIVALKWFCVNIEGPKVAFEKGTDGQVSETTLATLDPLEMAIAGNRAFALQYGQGEEKNSVRPSPSDDSQKPIAMAAPSKGAGKSAARGGAKTPA